jgi:hypothetical protein
LTNHQSATVAISITRTDGTVLRVERVLIGTDGPDAVDLEIDALNAAAYASARKLRSTPLVPSAAGRHADDAPTEPAPTWAQPRTPTANAGSVWVRPPERDSAATTFTARLG